MNIKRPLKVVLIIAIILAILVFAVNWFLTYRLEAVLKKDLRERVSAASDGFYSMDFQTINVGLFNGELTVTGITLKPDSLIFDKLKDCDSLPQTYLNVSIDTIHFKGLNLTWKFSYKKLNFDLFEISNPIINVYDSDKLKKKPDDSDDIKDKTLYDMLSRYINVLAVKEINLNHASFSYYSLDEDNNESIYSLQNVSFHAHGFLVDEDSYSKGKLLYSENFDFITHQPQTLLYNNQFTLNTDIIHLDTRDSIIQINKIELIPQKMLWTQKNQYPDSYVEADVDSLLVKGLLFKRENASDYLEARLFNISSSDIQYFETKKSKINDDGLSDSTLTNINKNDTIDLSWSLYSIVSPIFKRIAIGNIGIKNAKLAYEAEIDGKTDSYKMAKFNFDAYGFRVDSLADIHRKFLYSDEFKIDATDIDATLMTKNHSLVFGKMALNTVNGTFDIKKVRLWPISENTDLDYMQGSIDSLSIQGIKYDKDSSGISFSIFNINEPILEYVKIPRRTTHRISAQRIDTIPESTMALRMLTPLVKFLSIKDFTLSNGNLVFRDMTNPKDMMVYRLPKIDFHADNILLNKESLRNSDTYVYYDSFNFRFSDFDNLLPKRNYRLSIKNGYYTGWGGDLYLDQIKLIPQDKKWKIAPDVYISLIASSLRLNNVSYDKTNRGVSTIRSKSVDLISPHLTVTKVRNVVAPTTPQIKIDDDIDINLGALNVTRAIVKYIDRVSADSLDVSAKKITANRVLKNRNSQFRIQDFILEDPLINIRTTGAKDPKKSRDAVGVGLKPLTPEFAIKNLDVKNLKLNFWEPDLNLQSEIAAIKIKEFDKTNRLFSVASIDIVKPILKLQQNVKDANNEEVEEDPASQKTKNIYAILERFSKKYSIGRLNITSAEIDYNNLLDGKPILQQQVNSTEFDLTGFTLDVEAQKYDVQDFNFSTKNLQFPLKKGFYTLSIGELDIHKKDKMLKLDRIHLIPAYPKETFAYYSPKHSDWFDVYVGNVTLQGIDYPNYFSNNILNIDKLHVNDVELLNYKNQNIEVEHHPMPLIYEGLQKAPIRMNIGDLEVNNFMVNYQELSKGASKPGEIFFTDMNGKFEGFTNIVDRPQQYIKLDADGKLMGTGYFTATWYIPVDSLNNRFLLTGKLNRFELTDLNRLITNMAPVEVKDGVVNSLVFKTEASSLGAQVQMRFLYNDLSVSVLKNTDNGIATNKFYTTLANVVLKKNNPDKPSKKPREPFLNILRAPDHSTFNYIWQILQPPVVESVGVSQGKQIFVKKLSMFISRVKGLFKKDNKKDTVAQNPDEKK